jgi:hypothetical protein
MNDDFSIKLAGAVVKAIDGEASEVMEMHFHCNLGDGLPTKVWVLEFRDQKGTPRREVRIVPTDIQSRLECPQDTDAR